VQKELDLAGKTYTVELMTSKGPIRLEFFPDMAPGHVKNFLALAKIGFYDNLIFHRVIKGFMIQGGGFEPGMVEKGETHGQIRNEASNGLANERGTIAMARTNNPDSATDQFFINVKNNPDLNRGGNNPGYAVFGKVIEGMDVADKIRQVDTTTVKGHKDVPAEDVVIKSIRRVANEKADAK
jgi:peptidyl-prolyl cis-trans isomerase B (cyclophilin B)